MRIISIIITAVTLSLIPAALAPVINSVAVSLGAQVVGCPSCPLARLIDSSRAFIENGLPQAIVADASARLGQNLPIRRFVAVVAVSNLATVLIYYSMQSDFGFNQAYLPLFLIFTVACICDKIWFDKTSRKFNMLSWLRKFHLAG